MAERNPKDINKKLRKLTAEQAKDLSKNLNSAYIDAETARKATQKKPKSK